MDKSELNERAYDKIHPTYIRMKLESKMTDLYWKVPEDRQKELMESHKKEVEVYSYILSLIEKDNKL
jgi:hypothetical protein